MRKKTPDTPDRTNRVDRPESAFRATFQPLPPTRTPRQNQQNSTKSPSQSEECPTRGQRVPNARASELQATALPLTIALSTKTLSEKAKKTNEIEVIAKTAYSMSTATVGSLKT